MLPRVKIIFDNGALGSTSPSDDGVIGLVITAEPVPSIFALNTPYLITKLDDLLALGITAEAEDLNANIYKEVKEFYAEAPSGTKIFLFGVSDSVSMADMADKTKAYAKKLIESTNGELKVILLSRKPANDYTPTIVDGLDSDVYTAMLNAQALAEEATENLFAPVFFVIPGRGYSGIAANLRDLTEGENNRVAILIGDTVYASENASVGLLAGRIASIPVQRSIARVKSGAIKAENLYIKDKTPENANPDVINDKGFICFRTFVGKAGYYFTDDKLATKTTDDYALIPRRRTIDKAYRIGYQTLVEELSDELPIADNGSIPAPVAKNIQNAVENAIISNMGAFGNLGTDPSDPNDNGVECFIDPQQNVVSLSMLKVKLRVKPFGYPKYIDLYLGFKTTTI
jgi:hypothetical protein